MINLRFALILIVALVSCNSASKKEEPDPTSRLLPEPDILERLQFQKRTIDTLYKYERDKLIVWARTDTDQDPTLIAKGAFPDGVQTTYNILADSLGNILTVSEFPFSQSGDWSIALTHYFDKYEKTFAFERQTNFFNSLCTEGVAYETLTKYYDSEFQLITDQYELVDEHENVLKNDSCSFPYDHEFTVSKNAAEYLRAHRLVKSR